MWSYVRYLLAVLRYFGGISDVIGTYVDNTPYPTRIVAKSSARNGSKFSKPASNGAESVQDVDFEDVNEPWNSKTEPIVSEESNSEEDKK